MSSIENSDTFQKLNRETGKIDWKSLEPHYESGALVLVDASKDLVRVAYEFSADNRPQVEKWLTSGEVKRVETEDVSQWEGGNPQFWAVVVAPWVLIQPTSEN